MEALETQKPLGTNDQEILEAKIAQLTDYQLSWMLLATILHFHSLAGVSLGRSQRNVILEEIIDLLPDPEINIGADKEILVDEAKRRLSGNKKTLVPLQMLLPFFEPEFLDNSVLAEVLLIHLHDWYQRDAQTHEFPLSYEMDLLQLARLLICLNEGIYLDPCIWQIETEKIIRESKERWHRRWRDRDNAAYWDRRLRP